MPNSISHLTPALYLKIKFPKWIDVTAICIGAIAPDLTLFFYGLRNISHSLLGQVYWTIPMTFIINFFFIKYIASFMSKIANKNGFIPRILKYYGVDDWNLLKGRKLNKKSILITLYSALIGGLTHLLLDLPSHPYVELFFPWGVFRNFEFLWIPVIDLSIISIETWRFDSFIIVSDIVWVVEDIIFFIISLKLFRHIKKNKLLKHWSDLNIELEGQLTN
jgi:hypothetical protein